MKKIATYILGALVFSITSCITLEDDLIPVNKGGILSVMASVADLSTVNVGTKAEDDSHVDSLTMVIFDNNGQLLGKPVYIDDINSSFSIDTKNGNIIDGVKTIPLVPEGQVSSNYDLTACSIYMVANATGVMREEITFEGNERTTEDDFLNIEIPVESIGIPENGIPMMGKSGNPVDLSTSASEATVANVTMRKLYAKINVRFQVNAIQVADIPSFTLTNWAVTNIPKSVRLGEQEGETICANKEDEQNSTVHGITQSSTELSYGKPTIYHQSDYFEFTFYVPEHKVQPDSVAYPDGTNIEDPQRYKPLLCSRDKNPMYVTVNGEYIDHNSIVKSVTYYLYLGQNETDNFEVKRNQELNNIVTIKGLTNSAGASTPDNPYNISVDHRVVVNFNGFSLSMERESILDSHFEVRPLDIVLSPNSSLEITIPKDYQSWIAMEDNATGLGYTDNDSPYISGKGVRKYFTTNLVSELNGVNRGTMTINNNNQKEVAKHRIWIYIDENVNVYDKLLDAGVTSSPTDGTYTVGKNMYRLGKINIEYSSAGDTTNVSLNMQQWNLWRVWSADRTRYYDIEHEEEYLNNYASDQGYGQTQNGMPWGLNNIQFSYEFQSLYAVQSGGSGLGALIDAIGSILGAETAEEFANATLLEKGVSPNYDFYLTRDIETMPEEHQEKFSYFDYAGLYYNKRMAALLKEKYSTHQEGINSDATIDKLLLTESPKSALAYALNKNKRDKDGNIAIENIKWYLPALDEIEDIAKGAYDEFDKVFQNNLYWSSQPAFTKNQLNVSKIGNWLADYGKLTGTYYEEDKLRARSTFVLTNDGGASWVPCNSEAPAITTVISGEIEYWKTYSSINYDNLKPTTNEVTDFTSTPGNVSRTEKCRIRAVYRSGSVQNNN